MDAQRALDVDQGDGKTEFAKRNPTLEKLIPDCLENALDAVMPDAVEAFLDKKARHAAREFFVAGGAWGARCHLRWAAHAPPLFVAPGGSKRCARGS